MDCLLCNNKTNNIYNQMYICISCQRESLKLENKYEDDLSLSSKYEPPTQILDNLFIGSKLSALNEENLLDIGIKNVVIAGKHINKFKNTKKINFIELLIDDSLEQDLTESINNSNIFINQHHDSKILIYCNSGISRSASILIGYLIKQFNWSYETAFSFVKSKYSKAHPNSNFINQLKLI